MQYRLSQLYFDAVALSVIVSLVFIQASYFAALKLPKEASTDKSDYILGALFLLLMAPTLAYLLLYAFIPFFIVACFRKNWDQQDGMVVFTKNILLSFLATILAMIFFFLPSLLA